MPFVLFAEIHPLATVNAALNALATVLLVLGFVFIKQRRETAHKVTMVSAFVVSIIFLICYLAYHVWPVGAKATPFPGPNPIKTVYYIMLFTHIVLAAAVPFLTIRQIQLGFQDRRLEHIRLARWTFPIWLYVSVTGVLIYLMLYHLYPLPITGSIIKALPKAIG